MTFNSPGLAITCQRPRKLGTGTSQKFLKLHPRKARSHEPTVLLIGSTIAPTLLEKLSQINIIVSPHNNMDDADAANGDSSGLTFTTSAIAEPITRGPANVPGDYLEVHYPALKLPPRQPPTSTANTRKRKKSIAFTASDEASSATATMAPVPKRTRASTKNTAAGRVIPQSFEECSEPDKLLITMRDNGEDWKSIREKYTEITGETTAPSTLPNRYASYPSFYS